MWGDRDGGVVRRELYLLLIRAPLVIGEGERAGVGRRVGRLEVIARQRLLGVHYIG